MYIYYDCLPNPPKCLEDVVDIVIDRISVNRKKIILKAGLTGIADAITECTYLFNHTLWTSLKCNQYISYDHILELDPTEKKHLDQYYKYSYGKLVESDIVGLGYLYAHITLKICGITSLSQDELKSTAKIASMLHVQRTIGRYSYGAETISKGNFTEDVDNPTW
jgi:hypothetical protein